MSTKEMIVFAALAATGTTFATSAVWTGNSGNGRWCDNGNWSAAYPNGTADVATFSKDATVTLDASGALNLAYLTVTAGTTTLGATDGASFALHKAPAVYASGLTVAGGASLILDAPVTSAQRIDKWWDGAFTLRGSLTSSISADNAYGVLFGAGSNTVEGAGSITSLSAGVSLGNGEPFDKPSFLVLRDQAQINAKRLWFPVGARRKPVTLVQDGDETLATFSSEVRLGYTANNYNLPLTAAYQLTRGSLKVATGTLHVGCSGPGAFEQSGGTSVISSLSVGTGTRGTATLTGGRMTVGSVACSAVGAFSQTGGELDALYTTALSLGTGVSFAGQPTLTPSINRTIALHSGVKFDPDTTLTVKGAGQVRVINTMAPPNTLILDGGALQVAPGASLVPWPNATTPQKVTVTNGGTLTFSNVQARVATPLDLELSNGGKVLFPHGVDNLYVRSCLIAHRLVLDGEVQPKGRYQATPTDAYIEGASGASIVVPYVWTGAGDGTSWADGANWDGGAVPPNDGTAGVDLSRAAGGTVALAEATKINCLAFLPSGAAKKVTISGTGSLVVEPPTDLNTIFFVAEGAEVVFDVDFKRSTATTPCWAGFAGGGRLTFRRGFPSVATQALNNLSGLRPPLAFDGTIAFAGPNVTVQVWRADRYNHAILGLSRLEVAGDARVIFEKDCSAAVSRMFFSPAGFAKVREVVQEGGTINLTPLGDMWLTSYQYAPAESPLYVLKGGTLTAKIYLGRNYCGLRNRGGQFVMSGGTLNTAELRLVDFAGNNTYFHLTGGLVNLGGAIGVVSDNTWVANEWHQANSKPALQLGGVTIHPTTSYTSSALSAELTGINGPTVFDLADGEFFFGTMTAVKGAGDLVKRGAYPLTFAGTNTFTGTLTVESGNAVFPSGSILASLARLVVTGGSVELNGSCTAIPDELDLATAESLVLGEGVALTARRLIVGGVEQTGTVTFGSGTVTVEPSATNARWTGPSDGLWSDAANWSGGEVPTGTMTADLSEAAGRTIRVDAAGVNVASLVCNAHGTVTLAAAGGTFAFPANGSVSVGPGATLVLATDATLAGYTYKRGAGQLRVTAKMTSLTQPKELKSDASFLVTTAGETVFCGEAGGIRLWTANGGTTVLGAGAVCTNFVTANIWRTENGVSTTGDFIQNGGTLDMSNLLPNFRSSKLFAFVLLDGGTGCYTLNDGLLRAPAETTRFIWKESGTFIFRQNGGTAHFPTLVMSEDTTQFETYELNDGTLILGAGITAQANTYAIALNGGRIESTRSGNIFPAQHAVQLGGNVTFATAANTEAIVPCDLQGAGEIVHAGPGALCIASPLSGATRITQTDGRLVLDAPIAATNVVIGAGALGITRTGTIFPADCTLELASGTTLDLACNGEVTVGRLNQRGREIAAGVYSVATGRTLHGAITGAGTLRVLNGIPQGLRVILR